MRGNQTVWEINSTPSSEPPPSTTTNTKDHKKVMKPKKKKPSNLNIRKQGTIIYIYIYLAQLLQAAQESPTLSLFLVRVAN
jgi:hypothetical protein